MIQKRTMFRIGIFGVMVVGSLCFKAYQRGNMEIQASNDVRTEMNKIVVELPNYDKDKKFIQKIFKASHPKAFKASFTSGRNAKLDQKEYIRVLYGQMIRSAQKADKKELALGMTLQLEVMEQTKME